MPRIAVGGFLHETNTFAPTKATYDDFVHGGGSPSMALIFDVRPGRCDDSASSASRTAPLSL
jgi:metallopeptidase family M81